MSHIELTDGGYEFSVTAKGHTESKMCAAISCLLYTAAGYITNAGLMLLKIHLDPGDAELVWAGGEKAKFLFDLLQIGFLQLQEGDPKNIFIKNIKK